MKRALIAGTVAVAAIGVGVWQLGGFGAQAAPKGAVTATQPVPPPRAAAAEPAADDVIAVDDTGGAVDSGTTPMAQRVAVLGLLNKRNSVSRDVTLKPGQALRVGDTVVRLRACERTAPWEPEALTGAFVQLDVKGVDEKWRRPFSGWLYKERPSLNVVLHPVYDVWVKSCTMAFPTSGANTVSLAAPKRSNAKKSAPGTDQGATDEPAEDPVEDSAAESNPT